MLRIAIAALAATAVATEPTSTAGTATGPRTEDTGVATRPAGPAHPRTDAAATAGSAGAEHRQCAGIAAGSARTAGIER